MIDEEQNKPLTAYFVNRFVRSHTRQNNVADYHQNKLLGDLPNICSDKEGDSVDDSWMGAECSGHEHKNQRFDEVSYTNIPAAW